MLQILGNPLSACDGITRRSVLRAAGAGTRGGTLYGESDKHAAYPANDPVSPADLAATIYTRLGISPDLRIPNALGQPVPLVESGKPLHALFS